MQKSANDQSQYDTFNVVLTPNINRSGLLWQDKQPQRLCRALDWHSHNFALLSMTDGNVSGWGGWYAWLGGTGASKIMMSQVGRCLYLLPAHSCFRLWEHELKLACSSVSAFLRYDWAQPHSQQTWEYNAQTSTLDSHSQSSSCFTWQKGDLSHFERDCWC